MSEYLLTVLTESARAKRKVGKSTKLLTNILTDKVPLREVPNPNEGVAQEREV